MTFFVNNIKSDFYIDNISPDLNLAIRHFNAISDTLDSFFGIKTDNGIIQFILEENNKWLMDIPNPPSFVNYQQYLNNEQCIDLIIEIFNGKNISELENMFLVPIKETTLSIVMKL